MLGHRLRRCLNIDLDLMSIDDKIRRVSKPDKVYFTIRISKSLH